VKVAALPYHVIGVGSADVTGKFILQGEIGVTFCGSTVSMFALKESIAEVLLHLQCIDENTVSLYGICEIIFATYKQILPQVVNATLSSAAVTNLIVVGYCPATKCEDAYLIETNSMNVSTITQILNGPTPQNMLLGSGASAAETLLRAKASPSTDDYLAILQSVIDDPSTPTVGGQLVYGHTDALEFKTFGICVVDTNGVNYWRAGLNFNAPVFQTANKSGLHVYYPMLTR